MKNNKYPYNIKALMYEFPNAGNTERVDQSAHSIPYDTIMLFRQRSMNGYRSSSILFLVILGTILMFISFFCSSGLQVKIYQVFRRARIESKYFFSAKFWTPWR